MTPAPPRHQPRPALARLRALVEAALASREWGGDPHRRGRDRRDHLATAAADHAEARGATVVWGTCRRSAPPFWPWLEVLAALGAEAGLKDAGPPGQPAPMAGRFERFPRRQRRLLEAAGTTPLVVVLDDLHWADPASVELAAFHARRALQPPAAGCDLPRRRDRARWPARRSDRPAGGGGPDPAAGRPRRPPGRPGARQAHRGRARPRAGDERAPADRRQPVPRPAGRAAAGRPPMPGRRGGGRPTRGPRCDQRRLAALGDPGMRLLGRPRCSVPTCARPSWPGSPASRSGRCWPCSARPPRPRC